MLEGAVVHKKWNIGSVKRDKFRLRTFYKFHFWIFHMEHLNYIFREFENFPFVTNLSRLNHYTCTSVK